MQARPKKYEALRSWWEGQNLAEKVRKKKDSESLNCLPARPRAVRLGRQRVVITFAALALATKHDGSGQQEERGGDQQEQAETGENPHHLWNTPKKYNDHFYQLLFLKVNGCLSTPGPAFHDSSSVSKIKISF